MKILHIGKYFPPYAGGMENYLRDVMVSLAKQGIENSALVHQSDITLKSTKETYESAGQRLSIIRVAVWARFLFTPVSPTFPFWLSRVIQEQQPDILHIHMPNVSAFWTLLLPRAWRIPWIIHWHSDVLSSEHSVGLRLFYTLYRPFERAILKRSKAIIATSPPYLKSSVRLGEFKSKCHVVPLGLNPTGFPAPSPKQGAESRAGTLQILAIGRLTYYKGFEFLIQAMAELEEAELHLVGKGDQEVKLRTLTQELGLAHRITFHGHLPTELLAERFTACDCLCLPSIERTEAFGMVLLEAMCCGKATVVSDVSGSGMGWVVDNGITGLTVSPGNPQDLAKALQKLQRDRDKIRIMGEQGRWKFDRLFHIDQSVTAIVELYQKILDGNSNTHE